MYQQHICFILAYLTTPSMPETLWKKFLSSDHTILIEMMTSLATQLKETAGNSKADIYFSLNLHESCTFILNVYMYKEAL